MRGRSSPWNSYLTDAQKNFRIPHSQLLHTTKVTKVAPIRRGPGRVNSIQGGAIAHEAHDRSLVPGNYRFHRAGHRETQAVILRTAAPYFLEPGMTSMPRNPNSGAAFRKWWSLE